MTLNVDTDLTLQNPKQEIKPTTDDDETETDEDGETVEKYNPCSAPTCAVSSFGADIGVGSDDDDAGDVTAEKEKPTAVLGDAISPDIKWNNKPPALRRVHQK